MKRLLKKEKSQVKKERYEEFKTNLLKALNENKIIEKISLKLNTPTHIF